LHWVVGTTQHWNFSIQRQLGHDWFAELGYVGTKGSRLRSTKFALRTLLQGGYDLKNVGGAGITCDYETSSLSSVSFLSLGWIELLTDS